MATRTVTTITPAQLHKKLVAACAERGGAERIAEASGMTGHQVRNMRYGRQAINEPVALALGFKRVWIAK